MKQVDIFCKNTKAQKAYPLGTTLLEIAKDLNIKLENQICGAIVNNKVKDLSFMVVKSKKIEFIDISHPCGKRIYQHSVIFVLFVALKELFPNVKLKIEHAISNGLFCELEGFGKKISKSDISAIKEEMDKLINADLPFIQKGLPSKYVVEKYQKEGLFEKAKLEKQQGHLYSFVYFLKEYANYFYGQLLPSTGYIHLYDLIPYFNGILLRVPKRKKPNKLGRIFRQGKLFDIYQEHKDWVEILNVSTIGSLNDFSLKGRSGDIIKISEALHEKKVAEIANQISNHKNKIKVVLVAGPSASGKTTFSKRLGVQLAVNGLHPFQISLDNYFVNRDKTPLDENGEYDFEALEAIDVAFFNEQLNLLLSGDQIDLPKFDFGSGTRVNSQETLQLKDDDILIIEGIHGMNPNLLPQIDHTKTFKIFISALTQISIDEQNHISTADNRMLRRMIRDSKYRGYSASETIKRWPSVRKGEEKNIFPYQENADVMFNSSTIYELAVLKKYADPLLQSVYENQAEYGEATRLLRFLSYFKPIDESEIPPTSLLREFLGGSSFAY